MECKPKNKQISDLIKAREKGELFAVSGPSGAGKTVLCRQVLVEVPQLSYSISYTTRPKRPQEVMGKDYFFIGSDQFEEMAEQGQFLEWARVHGNLYGTSKEFISRNLDDGQDVLLDIDVQGALQIRRQDMPSVLIFVVPPSMSMLKQRLRKRGSDSADQIQTRIKNAAAELTHCPNYDYLIVNQDFNQAVLELGSIIYAERCHQASQPGKPGLITT